VVAAGEHLAEHAAELFDVAFVLRVNVFCIADIIRDRHAGFGR